MKNNKKEEHKNFNHRPDLVNLSNSFLKHFGCQSYHDSIPELDKILKGKEKIAVFLFDGLGQHLLDNHKEAGSFILEHKFMSIYSVNPPTTCAATTSFLTGKYPIETGWIGWAPYQSDVGYCVELFPRTNYATREKVPAPWDSEIKYPVKRLSRILRENGFKAEDHLIGDIAFIDEKPKSAPDLKTRMEMASEFFKNGGNFLYSYDTQPDGMIHKQGVKSINVDNYIGEINENLKKFVTENPDVLVISIADHGLIDVENVDLANYPEIRECMKLPIANEGRCVCFYLKDGFEEKFVSLFKKEFPDFDLLSKKEIIDSKYFGEGKPHPLVFDEIGDYVAIATSTRHIWDSIYTPTITPKLAHHAGGTKEEKEICLAIYNL